MTEPTHDTNETHTAPLPKLSYLRRPRRLQGVRLSSHAQSPSGSYDPATVLRAYGYAQGSAAGAPSVEIGVLSLGGGLVEEDVALAARAWGMPAPTVTVASVGGAVPDPSADPDANAENSLDVLLAAFTWWWLTGTAAKVRLCVGPNATDGMTLVLADLAAAGCPVVSCSWGGPEESWDAAERASFAAKLAEVVGKGVTFLAASGDSSADDGERVPSVDYPCGDPNALAVGGTSLALAADGAVASESAWGDGLPGDEGGGGGFDPRVPLPAWQRGVVPGTQRGAPDAAANADPETGWRVFANGAPAVYGGTSAPTPFLAALVAVAKARGGVPGLVSPRLYAQRANAFSDVTRGSNGFQVGPGWSAATGLGSPRGAAFFVAVATDVAPVPVAPAPPAKTMPVPTGPATIQNVLAWAAAGLATCPEITTRAAASAAVETAIQTYWPKVPQHPATMPNGRPPASTAPAPAPASAAPQPAPAAPTAGFSASPTPSGSKPIPDVTFVGYVGTGVGVRGVGGLGVEVFEVEGEVADEGARLVGWNRPGGTVSEVVKRGGPVRAVGAGSHAAPSPR